MKKTKEKKKERNNKFNEIRKEVGKKITNVGKGVANVGKGVVKATVNTSKKVGGAVIKAGKSTGKFTKDVRKKVGNATKKVSSSVKKESKHIAETTKINILINNLMRVWARVVRNTYKDEAYLTHTLPVSRKDIFLSKVLTAIITMLTSFAIIVISLAIAYLTKDSWQTLKSLIW